MITSRTRRVLLGLCMAIDGGLSAIIVYSMVTRWTRVMAMVTAALHFLVLLMAVMLVAIGMWLLVSRVATSLLRLIGFLQWHLWRNRTRKL
jgi:hydrogenase-4 membrane subunit HyfE